MALDFPNNPVNGQLFASGGMTWRFDSTKWTETAGTLALADAPSDGNTYGRRNTAWNSVDAMLAPVAANANAALNDSGRSLIHNGLFNIQQRGQGPWTAAGFTADRWFMHLNTDTVSTSIVALADAARTAIGDEAASYALQQVFTGNAAAAAYNDWEHAIENTARMSGKTVTVSFWAVRTAGTTTRIGVNFFQSFGSGGSPSASVNLTAQAVTISTTWARYSLTFAVPSTAGKVFGSNGDSGTYLCIGFSSGANNNTFYGGIGVQSGTVQLWGIQLEVGSVATPLARRDPQQELALCQRYFSTGYASAGAYQSSGNGVIATVVFPVTMRAVPSIAFSNTTYNNTAGITSDAVYAASCRMYAAASSTAAASWQTLWTASADL